MISSEKAFDMLPHVMDLYEKLELNEQIKTLSDNSKGKSKEAVGIELVKFVMKNSCKVKEEFFSIVSIIQEKDVETIKKQNFMETINSIKSLFSDKEAMGFFINAMK